MKVDPTLQVSFEALSTVATQDGYANLALAEALDHAPDGTSAAQATELTFGTCRMLGTHDLIIEAASGRRMNTLQPAVQQILRLTSHRVLCMDTPTHAAVNESVALARSAIGERVTGVVNAIGRKLTRHDLDGWLEVITANQKPNQAWATRLHHPRWIADVHRRLLGDEESAAALAANNTPASPTYVVRPGLVDREDLTEVDGFTRYSPHGFVRRGSPGSMPELRRGLVGIQDEGSQLVAEALARAVTDEGVGGAWLDLCAGPGGKAALLTGLARQQQSWLLANESQPHRARLVTQGLRAYPDGWQVVIGDGTRPAWQAAQFAAVMADVPCTGLGALRRRPEARWRKQPGDLTDLVPLQRALLHTALDSAKAGGVVAYVTCSPHPAETVEVVAPVVAARDDVEVLDAPGVLHDVPDCERVGHPRFVQLWPHRHGTDAMFLALLRRR